MSNRGNFYKLNSSFTVERVAFFLFSAGGGFSSPGEVSSRDELKKEHSMSYLFSIIYPTKYGRKDWHEKSIKPSHRTENWLKILPVGSLLQIEGLIHWWNWCAIQHIWIIFFIVILGDQIWKAWVLIFLNIYIWYCYLLWISIAAQQCVADAVFRALVAVLPATTSVGITLSWAPALPLVEACLLFGQVLRLFKCIGSISWAQL